MSQTPLYPKNKLTVKDWYDAFETKPEDLSDELNKMFNSYPKRRELNLIVEFRKTFPRCFKDIPVEQQLDICVNVALFNIDRIKEFQKRIYKDINDALQQAHES